MSKFNPKSFNARFDHYKWPYVLGLKLSDENVYYLVIDLPHLWCIALVATEIFISNGYIVKPPDEPSLPTEDVDLDLIHSLPPALKHIATESNKRNRWYRGLHADEVEIWTSFHNAILTKDGNLAFFLLDGLRKKGQIEFFMDRIEVVA